MALVNVNNQAMPMGDDTGRAGDGQTGPKRHFKHIIVTYGNTTDGRIALNKLNEQIARDMGIKVSELAVKDDSPKAEAQPKKADAKKTTAKK
jgi:hypothetical protein